LFGSATPIRPAATSTATTTRFGPLAERVAGLHEIERLGRCGRPARKGRYDPSSFDCEGTRRRDTPTTPAPARTRSWQRPGARSQERRACDDGAARDGSLAFPARRRARRSLPRRKPASAATETRRGYPSVKRAGLVHDQGVRFSQPLHAAGRPDQKGRRRLPPVATMIDIGVARPGRNGQADDQDGDGAEMACARRGSGR